jgi:hypothetical protein
MQNKSVGLLELETAVLECFLEKTPLSPLGVKPPKRGIELGWVTRGTRPKKPSSSRGFAHGAQGAWGSWGSWGLKTKNQKPNIFFLFSSRQLPKK